MLVFQVKSSFLLHINADKLLDKQCFPSDTVIVKSKRLEFNIKEKKMTQIGRPIAGSKNKEWGFYGAVKSISGKESYTKDAWNAASILIRDITDCLTPLEIMYLLDSKWGRHMADNFYDELKDGTFIEAFQKRVSKSDLIKAYNDNIDPNAYHSQKATNKELFCKELAKLSKKYGIVIQSVGGVQQSAEGFVRYNEDLDSGDLMPIWENN